jgi:hypothetical protein
MRKQAPAAFLIYNVKKFTNTRFNVLPTIFIFDGDHMSGALNTMNENISIFHSLCALCVSAVNLFSEEQLR